MYQDASSYGAMYDIRGPQPSIWYPDGTNDLHISLMFVTEKEGHILMNCLIEYNVGSISLLKGKLEVSREVIELHSSRKGTFVHRDDYKFEDSDSPSNTFDDVKSPTEVPITNDPLQKMRSLEDIDQISPGDTFVQMPHCSASFLSRLCQGQGQYYLRIAGANLDWCIQPRLKMEYESTGPDQLYLGTRYYMIRVLITFQDPSNGGALA
jgi:hypothetical protein